MSDWYYVRFMYYPFWNVSIENDCAMNVEADTDMGNLSVEEFHGMFPNARKVTQEQVNQGLAKLRKLRSELVAEMNEKHELPEPVRSQIAAMMALRDLQLERERADRMRDDSNTLYELRGWLRLCSDNPAGHAEFYQWACHYIFGDEPPIEEAG